MGWLRLFGVVPDDRAELKREIELLEREKRVLTEQNQRLSRELEQIKAKAVESQQMPRTMWSEDEMRQAMEKRKQEVEARRANRGA